MEAIIIIICLIIFILIISSNLSKRHSEELTPNQRKIVDIHQSINDTVKVNMNKVKKFTGTKLSLQYITSAIWRLQEYENVLYTFRMNGEVYITKDGIVEKGKYEYIVDNNSIIITLNNVSKMYYIINLKDDLLLLNDVGNGEVLTFRNETKMKDTLINQHNQTRNNSIEY